MPRKLPWVQNPSVSTSAASARPPPASRAPASRAQAVSRPSTSRRDRRGTRSPTSSPVPAPPPADSMREGFAADDRWIMVEDEFLSTARQYTAHLHAAAYKELKSSALTRNANTISQITRVDPDAKTSAVNKRRSQQDEGAAKRRDTVKTLARGAGTASGRDEASDTDEEDASEDEELVLKDSRLAGLMAKKREPSALLSSLVPKAKTRAAAGFSNAESISTQASSTKPRIESPRSTAKRESCDHSLLTDRSRQSRGIKLPPKASSPRGPGDTEHLRAPFPKEEKPKQSEGENVSKPSSSVAERRAKRQAEQAKRDAEEATRRREELLEVPTFLV